MLSAKRKAGSSSPQSYQDPVMAYLTQGPLAIDPLLGLFLSYEGISLARLNGHPRDYRIAFDRDLHVYYIDGDGKNPYVSVTTFIKQFFTPFNAHTVASIMVRRHDFPSAERYKNYRELCFLSLDMDDLIERIKAKWEKDRKEASDAGTEMH